MLFSKSSKKTRTIASEPAAAKENSSAKEVKSKPRNTRSSTTKTGIQDAAPARHREPVASDASRENKPAVRAAAAGASSVTSEASIVDPVGVIAPASPRTATHAEIAALAHSYWVGRGHRHGSPEQDWLRAEQELLGVR